MNPTIARLFFVSMALTAVTASPATAQDTTRAVAPADSGLPSEIRPPISAKRAFLTSLVLPGYGQSMLGRKRSGAMMLAMEAISVSMIRESVISLREARRNATDSVIVSYVDATGAPAVKYERSAGFSRQLVKARKSFVEDWVAVLVGNHLFSATDALVASLLWDLPAEVSVASGSGSRKNLGLRVRF